MKGYNKADLIEGIKHLLLAHRLEQDFDDNRPCVFLSHQRKDKPACRLIAKYLAEADIDFFLDEDDELLQQAVNNRNSIDITEQIKRGIRESSHMLVVISEKTYKSQWVPFEVGYGHAAIIDKVQIIDKRDDKIKLSILTLKDVAEKELPTFMQTGYIVRGTKSLNKYISKISKKSKKNMIKEQKIFSAGKLSHPLDSILNWQL